MKIQHIPGRKIGKQLIEDFVTAAVGEKVLLQTSVSTDIENYANYENLTEVNHVNQEKSIEYIIVQHSNRKLNSTKCSRLRINEQYCQYMQEIYTALEIS